jgi:hypothetical protein
MKKTAVNASRLEYVQNKSRWQPRRNTSHKGNGYGCCFALFLILSAYQKPTVKEKASIIIKVSESVYPLYTEAAINATVKTRASARLYVTLANKITIKPGNTKAHKYFNTNYDTLFDPIRNESVR